MYFTHYWQIIFQQQNHNSAVELGWKRSLCLAGFQNHPGDINCFESEAGLPQGFPGCTGQDARLVAPLPLPMPSRPATKPGESSLGRNKPSDTLSPFRAQLLLFPFFCWAFFKYTGNIFSYWSICDESKPLFKRNANSETSSVNNSEGKRKYIEKKICSPSKCFDCRDWRKTWKWLCPVLATVPPILTKQHCQGHRQASLPIHYLWSPTTIQLLPNQMPSFSITPLPQTGFGRYSV